MAQFATSEEFASHFTDLLAGRTLDTVRADRLLEFASGLIQNAAAQTLSYVEDDEVELSGTATDVIWLPERPVVDISSLSIGDGDPFETTGFTWGEMGKVTSLLGSWGGIRTKVHVTYSHGYTLDGYDSAPEFPPDLKLVCLSAAGRAYFNPLGASRESVGPHSVSFGGDAYLTPAERDVCNRYRRRTL